MGAKMITITKGEKKAQIVESSLDVWKDKGWSVKSETKVQTPKEQKSDEPKESATER